MKHAKLLGLIIVVIIVVAVAAFALSDNNDNDSPQIRYNYDIETASSIETSPGHYERPSTGQYLILHLTVANDSYEDGFSTNPISSIWRVTVNGERYNPSIDSADLDDYRLTTILPGTVVSYSLAYEIPAGISVSNAQVSLGWGSFSPEPSIEYDPSLS